MTFMYLQIRTDKEGKLHAVVTNDGNLRSLGTANSRVAGWNAPVGAFQIDSFDGLDAIQTEDLITEVYKRYSTKELLRSAQIRMTGQEILDLLRERLREP